MASRKVARARGTRTPRALVPERSCPARELRGAIHFALMRSDYAAYLDAWTAPYPPALPAEFMAAAAAFQLLETALLGGGPLRRWQREALAQMGAIARGIEEYDDQLEQVASWCEALLRLPKTAPDETVLGSCENVRRLLSTVRPEIASVPGERMAELLRVELAKRIPGSRSLAAALWKAAGLPFKRGKESEEPNKLVSAAVARSRSRRRAQND